MLGARFLGAAAMEILVLAIQLLSFALVLFGAWLCVGCVHREREEANGRLPSKTPTVASAPEPAESDLHHGKPA